MAGEHPQQLLTLREVNQRRAAAGREPLVASVAEDGQFTVTHASDERRRLQIAEEPESDPDMPELIPQEASQQVKGNKQMSFTNKQPAGVSSSSASSSK